MPIHPGDLLGSGTISGADAGSHGSLMEITRNGTQPLILPTGESRRFLEDGDALSLAGWFAAEGFVPIGFGPCSGTVVHCRN